MELDNIPAEHGPSARGFDAYWTSCTILFQAAMQFDRSDGCEPVGQASLRLEANDQNVTGLRTHCYGFVIRLVSFVGVGF